MVSVELVSDFLFGFVFVESDSLVINNHEEVEKRSIERTTDFEPVGDDSHEHIA